MAGLALLTRLLETDRAMKSALRAGLFGTGVSRLRSITIEETPERVSRWTGCSPVPSETS